MTCRLCLTSADILIPIYDSKGRDIKRIASTVQKYIGVQLIAKDKLSNKICVGCWANVDNFHKFCTEIIRTQQTLRKDRELEKDLPLVVNISTTKPVQPVIEVSNSDNNFSDGAVRIDNKENSQAASDFKARQYTFSNGEPTIASAIETNNQSIGDEVRRNDPEDCGSGSASSEEGYAGENINCKRNIAEKSRNPRGSPRKQTLQVVLKHKAKSEPNVRKIGRPRKIDASDVKYEQAIVASHIQLICDICQLVVKTFPELKQHFKDAHKSNGYVVCCKKRLYKLCSLMDHINVHQNPAYFRCANCDKNFADRACLRNHMLLKHTPTSFQCEHCDRKFAANCFLQRHLVKHVPVEQRIFHCDQCTKNYPTQSRLNSHLKNVHGNGSLKVCNLCGKVIRGKDNFERHMGQHEGVSRFSVQCTVCNQHLANKYVLRLHMEIHGDRKSHTCNICGKDTPSSSALREHNLYHHKEPRHKCTHCEKTFKTTRSLREHITTHTGETLYSCTYCDKRFKCSSNLHAHRKWGHPDEWAQDKKTTTVAI